MALAGAMPLRPRTPHVLGLFLAVAAMTGPRMFSAQEATPTRQAVRPAAAPGKSYFLRRGNHSTKEIKRR